MEENHTLHKEQIILHTKIKEGKNKVEQKDIGLFKIKYICMICFI